MKSITERRFINGKKWTKAEREAQQRSLEYLKQKYKSAETFFWVLWKLRLCDRKREWRSPFGYIYYGDKLTQKVTFGKYDANSPQRGSRVLDPTSVCNVPASFSEPVQVDEH